MAGGQEAGKGRARASYLTSNTLSPCQEGDEGQGEGVDETELLQGALGNERQHGGTRDDTHHQETCDLREAHGPSQRSGETGSQKDKSHEDREAPPRRVGLIDHDAEVGDPEEEGEGEQQVQDSGQGTPWSRVGSLGYFRR